MRSRCTTPVGSSQLTKVLPSEATAPFRPSGEKAAALTAVWFPRRLRPLFPLVRPMSLMVPSSSDATSVLPSGGEQAPVGGKRATANGSGEGEAGNRVSGRGLFLRLGRGRLLGLWCIRRGSLGLGLAGVPAERGGRAEPGHRDAQADAKGTRN